MITVYSCAYQTERIGYTHFAIKEVGDNTIACYAVDYNPSEVDIVLNDLNQLLLQSQCSQKCDKVGCVLMGAGDYAAVYQVIRKRMIVFYYIMFSNLFARSPIT